MPENTQNEPEYGPEPWELVITAEYGPVVYDGEGMPVGSYKANSRERILANGRRIVACVNACAKIDTEALEAGVLENIIEALYGLLDGLDSNSDPERCGLSQQQWDQRETEARAAIAQLERRLR
jgi:hypothetical protein